ncbi:MAG: MFS transporter [bacterium]|nr:MFS transporter [bacterium]
MSSSTDDKTIRVYRNPNLRIIFAVTLMGVLGVASITPAFPRIIQDLGIEAGRIGLLIIVFTLPGIFLSPFLGILADRFGRKRILVPSLALFAVAGGSCGLVRDFNLLLVLRFFQGAGGSALASLSATVIGDLFEGRARAAAMGYNASVLAVGTAAYPAVGGMLALFGWHYPFLLPFLALPVAWLVFFRMDTPEPSRKQGLSEYLKGAGVILANRRVIGVFMVSVATFIILYGSLLTFFPLLASRRFGASTLAIGLIMSCMSITTGITSTQLGRLTRTFSEASLIKISFLFYGAALAIIPVAPSLEFYLVSSFIFGLGHGMNIPCIMSLMAGYAPMEHRGVLMSVNGTVLRLGQTLGPLVMGLAFTLWGITGPFFAGAVLAVLVFVVGFVFVR